nr:SRPBCC domain-containing protein [Alicyclobacillus contaminans]
MVALNRLLEEEQHTGKDVSLHFEFKCSIGKVWAAFTNSSTLAKWLYPNDFKPVVGHKFQFRAEPTQWWDGIIDCEVIAVDEPHRLSYTWVSGGENTTVTWTFKQADDGTTHVHLEQTGFQAEQAFHGALYGWQRMANQLEKVLAER